MLLLLLLLSALWVPRVAGTDFPLDGHIRDFTVTRDAVFVSTEQSLFQLHLDLALVQQVSLRGQLSNTDNYKFTRVSDGVSGSATLTVNVLLPFISNHSLVLCGVLDNSCGHCEVLSLENISNIIHAESFVLGPISHRRSASVSFLVTEVRGGREEGETFILAATEQSAAPRSSSTCPIPEGVLHLFDTRDYRGGGIFSFQTPASLGRRNKSQAVGFVDGFQVEGMIYLFSNVRLSSGFTVRLLWLETKHESNIRKDSTLKSLRGATLGAHGELLASSVILDNLTHPTTPLTWAGVFGMNESRTNTELLLFDISPPSDLRLVQKDRDPHFNASKDRKEPIPPPTRRPLTTLLRQSSMNSVLARTHRDWRLFFIGTEDGQVIKLVVDKNFQPACPKVLHRANDDDAVFPKLHVNQEDMKHLYMAFTNRIIRIPVSNCSAHTNLEDCWSARDPQCVWCDFSQRCVFERDCKNSSWASTSEDFQQEKMVSFKAESNTTGQITLIVQIHVSVWPNKPDNFACQMSLRCGRSPPPSFPQCICVLLNTQLPAPGLDFTVKMRLWKTEQTKTFHLSNCSSIKGPSSPTLCRKCIEAGCGWGPGGCSWANEASANLSICQKMETTVTYRKPEIFSVDPNVVSSHGRNHAVLTGCNLSHVTRVRIQGELDCTPTESPVWNITDVNLTFHIPSADNKGVVQVCAVLPDNSCHGNAKITYRSPPSCADITPSRTWLSGGRTVTLLGSHMNFVDSIVHSHSPSSVSMFNCSPQNITYTSPAAEKPLSSVVFLKVANETQICSKRLIYLPDPVFSSYTSTRTGGDASITIQKKADNLDIRPEELLVWAVIKGEKFPCVMETKDSNNETDSYTCEIRNTPNLQFQHLLIQVGHTTVILKPKSSYLLLILLVLLLIPCIIIVVLVVYKKKQNQLTKRMNNRIEKLEMDIRNDIRQGFIDLQTENADLLENVGTIPFLDYKHFAARIFFPESEALMKSCVHDFGQDGVLVQLDECSQSLSRLIRDQLFLTSMVHVLEEQRSFSIKDKCVLASLLTVALHSDLCYLTEVMEVLLKDLMQQSGNSQPKLLLRRTESTVEKLLTNWTSICLYGFLREKVGQALFLLVSALSQQISKGPVDCVTEKALYTLSEDWLLWQAPDFTTLKLKVLFAVGADGELSEPLEVQALSCDTVDQVKDKILTTFRNKFGFSYNSRLRDMAIEYVRGSASLRLEEVDLSSEKLGDVTMLNTMKHYKIPDGATIKVLSRESHKALTSQESIKDDQDFPGKYFHLIDPDIVEDLKNPERKKLKLKEVHLTKLLSTKVAVHSFVEKLFRSIWGLQQNRAPLSIKYFFDFLDAQAEELKITDPDVLHIWKTNSLPLRFWVNILKNPQFVLDLEKSPHLDGCLSVIAQAFMDSFSLSELQLGKHTPTNKLLYGKEIPKYKQEVKQFYKQIQDQPPVSESEFRKFLHKESKKHEHEFNEAAALREIYKFISRYFTEIEERLQQNGAPSELKEQLHHVKKLFDGLKSCSWN